MLAQTAYADDNNNMKKTNALRLLDAAKTDYTARDYDVSDGEISGVAVAIKIGQEPERLFKTLVAVGKSTGLNVFVVPSSAELDLKKAARGGRQEHRNAQGAQLGAADRLRSRRLFAHRHEKAVPDVHRRNGHSL